MCKMAVSHFLYICVTEYIPLWCSDNLKYQRDPRFSLQFPTPLFDPALDQYLATARPLSSALSWPEGIT